MHSECIPRPAAKDRRLISRSSEIYSPADTESPVFNSPASPSTSGNRLNPLAIAGILLATTELDRLSNPRQDDLSKMQSPFPMTDVPPNSPASSKSAESMNPAEATIIGRRESLAAALPNTSASSGPATTLNTPTTMRQRQSRKRTRSRLSEVTTPEDFQYPELSDPSSFSGARFPFSPSEMGLVEESAVDLDADEVDDRLRSPRWPLFLGSEGSNSADMSPLPEVSEDAEDCLDSVDRRTSPVPGMLRAIERARDSRKNLSRLTCLLDLAISQSASSRSSSIGKTPDSLPNLLKSGEQASDDEIIDLKQPPAFPLGKRPNISSLASSPGPQQTSPLSPDISASPLSIFNSSDKLGLTIHEDLKDEKACHPDTWTADQGEPGDSDPFCPSRCASNNQLRQDNRKKDKFLMRTDTSETIHRMWSSISDDGRDDNE